MNESNKKNPAAYKVALFRSFFSGLTNVYGTYDPATGRSWQVKKPVTNETFLSHLKGERPYGVYLLDGGRTRAIAADFDDPDPFAPIEFVNSARHYQLPAYIETSKSKGFHVWLFFNGKGVNAAKARMVVKYILEEIERPHTEIFPKQDGLDNQVSFGNFINAPLFGRLVPLGKTVFIDHCEQKPYEDQWDFLKSVERVGERVLDGIIEINDLAIAETPSNPSASSSSVEDVNRFSLPPCAQKMLRDGVSQYQRVSCFRLAVHLKRIGMPYDIAVAALKVWAIKNKPKDAKQVIKEHEIIEQASWAYNNNYRGFGCNSEAVIPFCHPNCPVNKIRKRSIKEYQVYSQKEGKS